MKLSTLLVAMSLVFVESLGTKLSGNDVVRYSILEMKLDVLVERVVSLEDIVQNQKSIIDDQTKHITSLEQTIRKQALQLEAENARLKILEETVEEHAKVIEVIKTIKPSSYQKTKMPTSPYQLKAKDYPQTYNNNQSTNNEAHGSGRKLIDVEAGLTENISGSHFIRRAVIHASATPPVYQVQPGRVAFTAYLDHVVDHLGIDHTIPFDKVLLNDGNAFNVHTGMFQCPRSGVYLFIFYIQSKTQEVEAKLVVDGSNQIDALTTGTGAGWEMGGNAALLYVNAGQNVWVATYYNNDVSLRNTDSYRYTSFSGVLLY